MYTIDKGIEIKSAVPAVLKYNLHLFFSVDSTINTAYIPAKTGNKMIIIISPIKKGIILKETVENIRGSKKGELMAFE